MIINFMSWKLLQNNAIWLFFIYFRFLKNIDQNLSDTYFLQMLILTSIGGTVAAVAPTIGCIRSWIKLLLKRHLPWVNLKLFLFPDNLLIPISLKLTVRQYKYNERYYLKVSTVNSKFGIRAYFNSLTWQLPNKW